MDELNKIIHLDEV